MLVCGALSSAMGGKTAVAQGPRHGLQQASGSRAELPKQPDGEALALRGVGGAREITDTNTGMMV